ncbi:MAG: cbb3-type cytochrome oxidase assembly protein CcoS [Thermoanaerobaculia bacterium]|nr:cbb3-type cytochrome oxidase assembly protein CcoS [Thermoanaerobaculia bacterium]
MSVLGLLIVIGLLLAGAFLSAFFWAVRSGQFDDTITPSLRILSDGEPPAIHKGDLE